MSIEEVKQYYKEIIDTQQVILSGLKKTIFQIGTIRLVVAIACVIAAYFFWGNTETVVGIILVSFVVFLFLMNYHSKLFKKKNYSEKQILNAENELKALDYDFTPFDGAPEKISAEHGFSLDLDLFGDRSFFQSMNRTVTSFGKDSLADTLIFPLENKDEILARQEAVKELSKKRKLLAHFRAVGQMSEMDNLNEKDFAESFSHPAVFKDSFLWKSLTYILPLLYIILGIFVYLDMVAGVWFIPLYIITLIISSIPSKKSHQILAAFDSRSQVLGTYADLFNIIEDEKFDSKQLEDIQDQLNTNKKASKAISQLKTLHTCLMMSEAYPILLFINPVLLWNVRYSVKIEKWTEEHKNEIAQWFEAVARFDALVSWGIFAFNHPDYIYPTLADKFIFKGKALGHPMLHRDVCVRNDIDISRTPYFMVITGANMAGKSTYLRTIGVSHTLACAGAPVWADSLEFYPGRLVTNLRTADSLADNESYFFAELKRLKMIIDRLQSGEELFIILDEILKGTNSVDKQKGSWALMKQLVSLNGNGIIATHDLLLGDLEKEYPENIKNYRFEADITNDHLSFTYKMQEGVAQNMNASFLMRKMGITGV